MEGIKEFLAIKHGSGYGSGSGGGGGYGSGYGYGDGSGSKYFNGDKVYYIDGIPTVILAVKGFAARGYVINRDLTTTSVYIVRVGNSFAHGDSLEKAQRDAEGKHLTNSPVEERIDLFVKEFKGSSKISVKDLYEWHFRLTGSCSFGRDEFIKSRGIDMSDSFTIDEFIELTINSYGGDVIKELKKTWNEKA